MLHRDMIVHVRKAFETLYTRRSVLGVDNLKEDWLISIRDEQPRWIGPEIASVLIKYMGKDRSAYDVCDRMARLYTEMLKHYWGRGPYANPITKELTRTVHAAVIALAEPLGDDTARRKSDWRGATVGCQLIHSFRKILYPDNTPAHISDSVWRFLSTATLPIRNQSSRVTNHADTWYDMFVRYALIESAKLDESDWAGAFTARAKHPDICATIIAQIQSAERGGHCSEAESDKMRAAFGMGTRPEGQMGAEFDCLRDVCIDDLLLEAGDQASEIDPEPAPSTQVAQPEITPEKSTPKRGRPVGSSKKRLAECLADTPKAPVAAASDPQWIVPRAVDTEAKTRRLISALDARKDWRRTDGTLYSYFRVTGGSFIRVADRLAEPTLVNTENVKTGDLLCAERELNWQDGPLPHEQAWVFTPISSNA